MSDQPEAQLLRNALLQLLDLRVGELDDLSGTHVDQVIVVLLGALLITRDESDGDE
jgi:hypothetical protein